jgi:3-oxoadipate enol-lactonase
VAQHRGRATDGTFWWVDGGGPAVVLIHGVGLDHAMWAAQAEALAGAFTVVRYDMAGHGLSARLPGPPDLAAYAAQLCRLLVELGIDAAHLVGFSMGGLVAQRFALDHPDRVRRLVLMNTVYDRPEAARHAVLERLETAVREGPSAGIEAALERWFTPGFRGARPDAIAAVRRRLEANDPEGFLAAYRVFATADRELAGRLFAIAAPTLVMTGADDRGSTPEMARLMVEAIPGARLDIIPAMRHLLPVEGAGHVNLALADFLRGEGDVERL